jgi:hypothetical protein
MLEGYLSTFPLFLHKEHFMNAKLIFFSITEGTFVKRVQYSSWSRLVWSNVTYSAPKKLIKSSVLHAMLHQEILPILETGV